MTLLRVLFYRLYCAQNIFASVQEQQLELNKVGANIAIGRNWGGVHYRSDYTESIYLGENVALGILQEQSLCYHKDQPFKCTLTKFDGKKIRIEGRKISKV